MRPRSLGKQRKKTKQQQVVQPKVCIVIINWNSLVDVSACLGSLKNLEYPNYEVVVVDNASTDDSAGQIERNFAEVVLLRNEVNKGYGGGNNTGIEYALKNDADYVWLLNGDTKVEPDALGKLVDAIEMDTNVGMVGPLLYYYSTPSRLQYCGSTFDWRKFSVSHFDDIDDLKSVNGQDFWLWGTAVLVRREVFEKIGLFDQKYFVYCDDMEFAARTLRAGYKCRIEKSAKIYHKSHDVDICGPKSLPLHWFFYTGRNRYRFWLDNSKPSQRLNCRRVNLARVCSKAAYFKDRGLNEGMETYLDGAYCGMRDIGGIWDKNIKMPRIWRRIIVSHPHLWADLLQFNIRGVLRRVWKKVSNAFARSGARKRALKRVVFLTDVPQRHDFGGCERRLLEYFRRVDYTRSKVTVAVTKDVFTSRLQRGKLPVKVVAYPFDFNGGAIKRFRQMRRFLKSLSADGVVFVQNNFMKFSLSEFVAGWSATKNNAYSLEVLGAPQPQRPASRMHFGIIPGMAMRWRIQRLSLMLRGRFCRRILAISEEVKERMVKWYRYPEKRIAVVYYGIDLQKFCPDDSVRKSKRQQFGIGDSDLVIVSTARLCEQKCLDRLIDVFDMACRDSQNVRLFLVGDGPLREQLENLAKQKAYADRIKFLGHQDCVTEILKMSDIYVLPSDNEGLGIAMLEAMAAGLVVVVTKTPGPKEVINDGVNGFLVERSTEGVLQGLEKAFSLSDKQRREISDSARQTIERNFDIEERTQKALGYMGLEAVAAC